MNELLGLNDILTDKWVRANIQSSQKKRFVKNKINSRFRFGFGIYFGRVDFVRSISVI